MSTSVRPAPPSISKYLANVGSRRSPSTTTTLDPVWDIAAAKFKVVVDFPSPGFDDVTTNTRFFEPTLRNCKVVRRDRNDSARGLWGFVLRIIRFLSASGSPIISPSTGLAVICARSSEVYIL